MPRVFHYPTPKLLSISEAARRIGIHRQTLYAWIDEEKIEITKICGYVFVMKKEVEKIIKKRKAEKNWPGRTYVKNA